MNDSDEILIERYLDEELALSERKEFEQRLETDPKFKEEFLTSVASRKLITEAGRLDFISKLEDFDRQSEDASVAPKVTPLWIKRALPIAAMLVVFFGVYQFLILDKSMSSSEVYDTYFQNYNGPTAVRDVHKNGTMNWELAAMDYRDKNYKDALYHFELAEREMPSANRNFYIAMSAMSMSEPDYQKALENFDLVLQSDNDYREQSLWYKGLLLLKMKRADAAKDIFKEIVAAGSYKAVSAQQILDTKIED